MADSVEIEKPLAVQQQQQFSSSAALSGLPLPVAQQRVIELGHLDDAQPIPLPEELKDPRTQAGVTDSIEARRWVLGRAILGEFLATFLFLFIAMAVPWNMRRQGVVNPTTSAVAVSFIAVAVIYSFADISGAHFNPAVTFATMVTGKTTAGKGLCFMFAQLLGATLASFWFILVFPDANTELRRLALLPSPAVGTGNQLMMEFTLTFVLVYVIFSVAFDTVDSQNVQLQQLGLDKELGAKTVAASNLTIYQASSTTKSGFAPIAIGFTMGMLALVGGTVSGGAYNPARVFGPSLCTGLWSGQWVYWLGDLCGAACAGHMQLLFQKMKKLAGTK